MQMENNLFRKKSLERISSPEELHDYMQVTSPRLWMLLSAIAALLVGFIVYASTVTMENTMKIQVDVQFVDFTEEFQEQSGLQNYTLVSAKLPASQMNQVDVGMTVRIGKETGKVSFVAIEENEITLIIETNKNILPLPDGSYDAELVLESTTPISFLWN